MHAPSRHDIRLVRAIGRWSLAALMFNTIIGASVFGVPSLLAARLGALSVPGYLIAAVGVAIIAACLAEVASQFREAGGPYLYARTAFGPFVAIQIGWMMWLSRITATSAVANLFISYGAQFFPTIEAPLVRALVLGALITFVAAVNYRGVSGGTAVSNVFTVAKLGLLTFLIAGGLAALWLHPALRVIPPRVTPSANDWFDSLTLMVYAYAGFEAAFLVSGETRDPRQDAPFALLVSIATATLVFVSLQYVVIHILPDAAASAKPAADAAQRFLGPGGRVAGRERGDGLDIRVSECQSAARTAADLCDGRTRRLPPRVCRRSPALPHALRVDCVVRRAGSRLLRRRKFSLECDPFRTGADFCLWRGRRRPSGTAEETAARRRLSSARGLCFRRARAGLHGRAGDEDSARCGRGAGCDTVAWSRDLGLV